MRLNDLINIVKRLTRYAPVAAAPAATDQPTLDILNSINVRGKRIWSKWNWGWVREPIAFAVIPGTSNYVVLTTSGNLIDRIINLIPNDTTATPPVAGAPLQQVEEDEFYTWLASEPDIPDVPTKYINQGLDANGRWQVRIWPSPSAGFTMHGSGKKLMPTYLAADFVANSVMTYFPDGIIEDVLLDGVKSDIAGIQGDKAESTRLDVAFEAKLRQLVQEQAEAGRDTGPVTSPVPDSFRSLQRKRGKGTGVY